MESVEKKILKKLGIDDPYQIELWLVSVYKYKALMNEEPPSDLAEQQRIGLTKKIQVKIREIYQNFYYKTLAQLAAPSLLSYITYV